MTKLAIGLIGGIATGKSLTLSYFKSLGYDVIDTDQVARDIVKPGSPILKQIVSQFSSSILDRKGELDRAKLRSLIFENPSQRLWLENLMHGAIRQKIDKAIEAASAPYCVVAIPLLKRREDYPKLSYIVMIDASDALKLKRVLHRDGISQELGQAMIASQPSREEQRAISDVVIVNDGDEQSLFKKIKALAISLKLILK